MGDFGGGYRPYQPPGGGPRLPVGGPPSPVIVAPKRSPLARVVATVVLSTVGSCIVAGAIFSMVFWLSTDMRHVTHDFLDHVRARRYDAAYAMTSSRLRASVPAEAFPRWVDTRAPQLHTTSGQWVNGFAGGSGEECIDVMLSSDNLLFPPQVYLLLSKEGGEWRVDGLETTEPALCAD